VPKNVVNSEVSETIVRKLRKLLQVARMFTLISSARSNFEPRVTETQTNVITSTLRITRESIVDKKIEC
jgi:hypothetical protein